MLKMIRVWILIGLLMAAWGCSPAVDCRDRQNGGSCLRILFIGNSYTYVNDLPGVFANLARSGAHPVETDMIAPGGWTLSQHAGSNGTLDKINSSKWDYVVLQEQSTIPAFSVSRTQEMYPAARQLAGQIEAGGAEPVFFITWGHREGVPVQGLTTYAEMQSQIDQGYLLIAQELNLPVAPVGQAWWTASQHQPPFDLWQADGSHPTQSGTYLAACVFYAVIFNQSPEGLTYRDGLSQETARSLQTIAANTVFYHP